MKSRVRVLELADGELEVGLERGHGPVPEALLGVPDVGTGAEHCGGRCCAAPFAVV